jgi:hypothetical protein
MTTIATSCADCGGTIEGGYCTTYGLAAAPAASAASTASLARHAPDLRRRIELVDLANNVRPGTWS